MNNIPNKILNISPISSNNFTIFTSAISPIESRFNNFFKINASIIPNIVLIISPILLPTLNSEVIK